MLGRLGGWGLVDGGMWWSWRGCLWYDDAVRMVMGIGSRNLGYVVEGCVEAWDGVDGRDNARFRDLLVCLFKVSGNLRGMFSPKILKFENGRFLPSQNMGLMQWNRSWGHGFVVMMPEMRWKSWVFFVEKVYPYPHSSQTQNKWSKKDKPECAFVFSSIHGVVILVRIRGDGFRYSCLSRGYVVSWWWWYCMCRQWHMHGNVREDCFVGWVRGMVCDVVDHRIDMNWGWFHRVDDGVGVMHGRPFQGVPIFSIQILRKPSRYVFPKNPEIRKWSFFAIVKHRFMATKWSVGAWICSEDAPNMR